MPEWRDGTVRDTEKAVSLLKKYKWSSLPDYLDMPTFPKIIEKSFLVECIGCPQAFLVHMRDWMQRPNFDVIHPSILRTDV